MTSREQSLSGSSPRPAATELLAINGGQATIPSGPPAWPPADDDVRAALEAAWADGSWGQYHGPHCDSLSGKLAEYHGCDHVLLCCSGTFAVELALRGLGIGAGDEVILAGYDFPGNFRAVEAVGARPVLVDVERRNWNLDPDQLPAAVTPAVKAIIASHLHGGIVPMDCVMKFAAVHGLAVVEDACQSPGAMIAGRRAGAWGDVGVLSFGGSKLLTAGRGGALLTSRTDVYQRAKVFCERGNQAFPLSELQAAVLLPQLAKLDARNATRADNVARLVARWRGLDGLELFENRLSDVSPAYYKLGLQLDNDSLQGDSLQGDSLQGDSLQGDSLQGDPLRGTSRDHFSAAVRAEGVALDAGFRGFARRSTRRCRHAGELTHSRRAAASTLVLHHPVLLEPPEQIDRVAAAVEKVIASLANAKRQNT